MKLSPILCSLLICGLSPCLAPAEGSWPVEGRKVMPIFGQMVQLARGPGGQVLAVGYTPLCIPQPDAQQRSIGLSEGILSKDGDVAAGNGSELVIDCVIISTLLDDPPRYWESIVSDDAGNLFAIQGRIDHSIISSAIETLGPGGFGVIGLGSHGPSPLTTSIASESSRLVHAL